MRAELTPKKGFFEGLVKDFKTLERRLVEAHSKRTQVIERAEAPKLSGKLASTVAIDKRPNGTGFGHIVFPTQPYAGYVHGGTGLYGPKRQRIVARFKKALRWIGANGKAIFARSTAGQKPNPFVTRTFKRITAESKTLIAKVWSNF